jgi:choline dehydrogenase-like flavoprotein
MRLMAQEFDFVVVGGCAGGAVIAACLTEDPSCRVALIEAGGRPPGTLRSARLIIVASNKGLNLGRTPYDWIWHLADIAKRVVDVRFG